MRSVKPAGTLVRLLTKPGHHLHALEALSLACAILSDPSPFSPNITELFCRCLISTGTSVFALICVEQTWWTHIRWIATWLQPSCQELVDQRPRWRHDSRLAGRVCGIHNAAQGHFRSAGCADDVG
jgi:hypothetical protein